MNKKAVGLLSGGLDSTLAVKIMLDMGIEVIALNFLSPFCTCTSKSAGCKSEALKASKQFGIKSKTLFLGEKYLEMVKNPKYGYGSNINPCIDCRVMMFKDARQFMIDEDASFVFTGEVLDQRPMSQRRDTMNIIERDSELKGLVVRPLSARFLKPTLPEIHGIINRNHMLKIRGRSRKPQIALAKEKGIYDYPCAAGGCLLTNHDFANRLRDLHRFQDPISLNDARLLRVGRHLRINDRCKIIVGRNKEENEKLERLMQPGDHFFRSTEYKGPLVMAKGEIENGAMEMVSAITAYYSKAPKTNKIPVEVYKYPDCKLPLQEASSLDEKTVNNLLL